MSLFTKDNVDISSSFPPDSSQVPSNSDSEEDKDEEEADNDEDSNFGNELFN